MEINFENIDRIIAHIKSSPSLNTCSINYHSFDENELQDCDNACLICYRIPVYPVILPCSHLYCNSCYFTKFTINFLQNNFELYYRCPYCRKNFKPSEALTLTQYIEKYPNSPHANYYNATKRLCSNVGCTKMIELSRYVEHSNTNCQHRTVQCPAPNCPIIEQFPSMMVHSINCPFHYYWCDKCKTNWTICVKTHDCERTIARNLIRGFITNLQPDKNKGHLMIQLPPLKANPTPSNVYAIDKVNQAYIQRSQQLQEQNLDRSFLIDEDTILI